MPTMKRLYFVAALFAAGAAGQAAMGAEEHAMTDLDILTNIYFPPQQTNAEVYASFEEAPDGLIFRATEGDVACESVTLIGQGSIAHIYGGEIAVGNDVHVSWPASATGIERLGFNCHADGAERSHLHIALE